MKAHRKLSLVLALVLIATTLMVSCDIGNDAIVPPAQTETSKPTEDTTENTNDNVDNNNTTSTETQGLRYMLNTTKDGYEVCNIGIAMDNDIVIPNTYNDLPVTGISEYAFSECRWLTSVSMPNTVTFIGNGAFEECISLKNISMSDSIESIGSSAFAGCTSLNGVTIPKSVKSIGYSAFRDCIGLSNIIIPDDVTSIEMYTFADCTKLESITIPKKVTKINMTAISNCTSLKNITFGGTSAEWNAISKIYDGVEPLGGYCVTCTDIKIYIGGIYNEGASTEGGYGELHPAN